MRDFNQAKVAFGSKPVRLRRSKFFPVYPQQRTFVSAVGTSVQGLKRTCISRRSAGPFKQTVVASRQSKVDWRAAAQSREALRSSSRQRLALMAWRLCRSHRRR